MGKAFVDALNHSDNGIFGHGRRTTSLPKPPIKHLVRVGVRGGSIAHAGSLGENCFMVDGGVFNPTHGIKVFGFLGASNFLLMFKPSPKMGHIVPDRIESQFGPEVTGFDLGMLDVLKDAVEVVFPTDFNDAMRSSVDTAKRFNIIEHVVKPTKAVKHGVTRRGERFPEVADAAQNKSGANFGGNSVLEEEVATTATTDPIPGRGFAVFDAPSGAAFKTHESALAFAVEANEDAARVAHGVGGVVMRFRPDFQFFDVHCVISVLRYARLRVALFLLIGRKVRPH